MKTIQKKMDNLDLSQMNPAEKKLVKDLLKLSKTTKVRPTKVSQRRSISSYQISTAEKPIETSSKNS